MVGTAGEGIAKLSVLTAGPADVNGDGVVSFADVLVLIANWGPCIGPCQGDIDGSGDVGFSDLLVIFADWG